MFDFSWRGLGTCTRYLLKEPLNKYMTTLAYNQCRYQDALAQECVDLSSQCNAESGIGCRPLWAGPVAPRRFVVALAKDDAITGARRLAAERDILPQSSHILVQRLLRMDRMGAAFSAVD